MGIHMSESTRVLYDAVVGHKIVRTWLAHIVAILGESAQFDAAYSILSRHRSELRIKDREEAVDVFLSAVRILLSPPVGTTPEAKEGIQVSAQHLATHTLLWQDSVVFSHWQRLQAELYVRAMRPTMPSRGQEAASTGLLLSAGAFAERNGITLSVSESTDLPAAKVGSYDAVPHSLAVLRRVGGREMTLHVAVPLEATVDSVLDALIAVSRGLEVIAGVWEALNQPPLVGSRPTEPTAIQELRVNGLQTLRGQLLSFLGPELYVDAVSRVQTYFTIERTAP
jgi:hypothetical protein